MSWSHAIASEAMRGRGQDRAAVIDLDDALVIVLADGAGGTGGGDVAADAIVAAVVEAAPRRPDWGEVLEALDHPRLGGESTAVVMTVEGLLKYAPRADIARIAVAGDVHDAAHRLVELVRLRSGGLPDDVSVVVVRAR